MLVDQNRTYDEPSYVEAKDGQVSVEGPDAVKVSLTPEAACETGERLIRQGDVAAEQRRPQDPQILKSREALKRSTDLLRKTRVK